MIGIYATSLDFENLVNECDIWTNTSDFDFYRFCAKAPLNSHVNVSSGSRGLIFGLSLLLSNEYQLSKDSGTQALLSLSCSSMLYHHRQVLINLQVQEHLPHQWDWLAAHRTDLTLGKTAICILAKIQV